MITSFRTISHSPFLIAVLLLALCGPAGAGSVITEPGDLEVRGHGPEPDALMNHYALENSTPFQIRIIRGVCSSNTNTCVGGGDDGAACAVTTDCASGPLNFLSGEVEMYDADGNSVAGPFPFSDTDFEDGTSLGGLGICAADSTVSCSDPGGSDEDSCGNVDPTCDARPSPGYVPDHANFTLRVPEEIVGHNLVPAEAEVRICFDEFDDVGGCDEVIVRQTLTEYRVPPGQTYIYPMPAPDTVGEVLENNEAHEFFSHHRGVNNQRHAYDVLSNIGGSFRVASSCVDDACDGGVRDGDACSENLDCSANGNYYVYQEPILAMADGVVVALTQGYPENPNPPEKLPGVTSGDCRVVACGGTSNCDGNEVPVVGNSVFIQHANGEVSMAAHIIPGTNDHLSCGDVVLQGDVVGLVGNSGNSTAPHLHYSTDVMAAFWAGGNYSLPSYYTNAAFAFGPDPTVRRQLDVSLHSFTTLEVWAPVTPLASNAPLAAGAVNEAEPNDTLPGHNTLTLPTTVTGVIENQDVGDLAVRGDGIEDVFRFDLGAPDEIRIALTGADPGENLDIYALTEDLRVLNETGQGTSPGATEAVCLNLDAGAYYLMATNVELSQDKDEDYTLEVSSDPQTIAAVITNAQQPVEVDDGCMATVEFTVSIHDNCCLDTDNLALDVSAANPTNNLTLGSVVIDSVVANGPRDVEVTGHVDVSDVTSCPAEVVIDASAQDCSGNVVDTVSQGTSAEVEVIDATPPQIVQTDDDLFCMWPPEHNYVCFDAAQFMPAVTDNCDANPTWEFAACTSDQPDNGKRDGNTVDDCVLDGDSQGFCARSERQGGIFEGRRYDLDITATDVCANTSLATEMGNIHVPHDENPQLMCIDSTLP
ncbi:M23 family metallopeptidase [Elongatibacter sediminis]|uniref:M23 family metallopeptidase n=1 Tax=Elongatibacter sediminis TaxID=3119006 RepID=A0AAW9RD79_9GAMM